MMLLIHFQYPILGAEAIVGHSINVDYHRAGLIMLYLSALVSVFSGAQYVRNFFSAAWRTPRPTR